MSSQAETQTSQQPANPVNTGGLRAVLVFGADHYVGKTTVGAALCREIEGRHAQRTLYLLPAFHSTGTDIGPVTMYCEADAHVIRTSNDEMPDLDELDAARTRSNGQGSGARVVDDNDAAEEIMGFIKRHAPEPGDDGGWLFIESLDGVMTPYFTGPPQAEVFRPLGFPVVLVGSSEFNGVALTISAFESLNLRGYNVIAVVMAKEEHWKNYRYADQYFGRRHPSIQVLVLPEMPARRVGATAHEQMEEYHRILYDSGTLSPLISSLAAVYR